MTTTPPPAADPVQMERMRRLLARALDLLKAGPEASPGRAFAWALIEDIEDVLVATDHPKETNQ